MDVNPEKAKCIESKDWLWAALLGVDSWQPDYRYFQSKSEAGIAALEWLMNLPPYDWQAIFCHKDNTDFIF